MTGHKLTTLLLVALAGVLALYAPGDAHAIEMSSKSPAVAAPSATSGTAVTDSATTILSAIEVISYTNFCVWVKNAGGGSGNDFLNVDIDASPNNSDWVDLNWSACDTSASGTTCVYCVSGNAYRYIRVQANCDTDEDTTADAWFTANKG